MARLDNSAAPLFKAARIGVVAMALIGLGAVLFKDSWQPKASVASVVEPLPTITSTTMPELFESGSSLAEICPGVLDRLRAIANPPGWVDRSTEPAVDAKIPVVVVKSTDLLRAAILAAKPGSVIEISAGSYEGVIDIPTSGTPGEPIVIRPQTPGTVNFIGVSSMVIGGSNIVVQGFNWHTANSANIVVRGTGITIQRNEWSEAGNGANDFSTGLIVVPNDATNWDPDGVLGIGAPPSPLNLTIRYNRFTRVRNTVLWQNHGVRGTIFEWNVVEGPHGIAPNGGPNADNAAVVKIGYGFGGESTNTVLRNNLIKNWGKAIYVFGIKGSDVRIEDNVILGGTIEVRWGNRSVIQRNVIYNGSITVSGSSHRILDNAIWLVDDQASQGAIAITYGIEKDSLGHHFDGSKLPLFYLPVEDSAVKRNVVVSESPMRSALAAVRYDGVLRASPTGNEILANLFVGRFLRGMPYDIVNGEDLFWSEFPFQNRLDFNDVIEMVAAADTSAAANSMVTANVVSNALASRLCDGFAHAAG
jgi:Chondroitinase B